MGKAVGIDLGTTNSAVAVVEAGKPAIIVNAEGDRVTPSVVAFTKDNRRLVGTLAKRQAIMNPEATIFSAKRFIGRKYDEVTSEMKIVPYKVERGENDKVYFQIQDKKYAPEEISAQVLRKLVDDAANYLGEKITDAVITVPAYFNDAQRQATKDAGQIAGLNVLRIINEPTAAALSYGLDSHKNQTVMIFDLGGGTFDVSILDIGDGVVEVLSTSGDTHLGGDDFDKLIVDYLAEEFIKTDGIDLRKDKQALQRLYEAAEKGKVELSSTTTTNITLPFITADASGPRHLDIKLTRTPEQSLLILHAIVEQCVHQIDSAVQRQHDAAAVPSPLPPLIDSAVQYTTPDVTNAQMPRWDTCCTTSPSSPLLAVDIILSIYSAETCLCMACIVDASKVCRLTAPLNAQVQYYSTRWIDQQATQTTRNFRAHTSALYASPSQGVTVWLPSAAECCHCTHCQEVVGMTLSAGCGDASAGSD